MVDADHRGAGGSDVDHHRVKHKNPRGEARQLLMASIISSHSVLGGCLIYFRMFVISLLFSIIFPFTGYRAGDFCYVFDVLFV